jgi:hypothetical protein
MSSTVYVSTIKNTYLSSNILNTSNFSFVNGKLTASSASSSSSAQWTTTGNNIYYNTGNVGIGISPNCKLDIYGVFNITTATIGVPSIGTFGNAGDKLILDKGTGSLYPYSLGINASTLWYSVPATATHKWYSGGTNNMTLDGTNNLTVTGNINSSGIITSGSGISTFKRILITNPDARQTLFTWTTDNANYIRGKLNVDQDNIYCGGRIGIGVVNPSYRLHVVSTSTSTGSMNVRYFNAGASAASYTYFVDISAYFGSTIWCASWITSSSDIRIKNNIQDITDDTALQQILNIQPKTYDYKDKVKNGDKRVYGFIAQQIKEVIPEAISLQSEVIPNIYKNATCENNKITLDYDISNILKINDKIDIIDNNGKYKQYNILSIENNSFTIDDNIETNNVFVYGSKVDDFHTLSKDYIFTLNVCATQELYKLIQEQNILIQDIQDRLTILENK